MNEPKKKSSATKFVIWGAVTCLLIAFALAIVIPNRPGPRTSPANACINNLRQIDGAKEQWALDHNAKTNETVPVNQLTNYLYRGAMLQCPSGGVYKIGKVGEPPTCSLGNTVTPAHVLPP
jgi:hypothetical protein